jgi:hypothetical protein
LTNFNNPTPILQREAPEYFHLISIAGVAYFGFASIDSENIFIQ